MLESVTADSVFVEIMMDETSPNAFVLVEGPDENSIFFGHMAPDVVLLICGGKKNVIGAAKLAESEGYGNVYGLVDSDFDRLRGLDSLYPRHVVATEAYDLIADLVMSSPGVLRRSLSAHAAAGVRKVEDHCGTTVDNAVFALTSMLAGARLATIREGYPLIFKGFDFSTVVEASYAPAGMTSIAANVVRRDQQFDVDAEVIVQFEAAFTEVGADRLNSGGHDIVAAAVALLRKAGSQVSIKTLNGTLISTATCSILASLRSIQALCALARTDSGVELLDCCAA